MAISYSLQRELDKVLEKVASGKKPPNLRNFWRLLEKEVRKIAQDEAQTEVKDALRRSQ